MEQLEQAILSRQRALQREADAVRRAERLRVAREREERSFDEPGLFARVLAVFTLRKAKAQAAGSR
jgi:hypothetical protein